MLEVLKHIANLIVLASLGLNIVILFPQIIKILKTKQSSGISPSTFITIWLLQFITILHGYFHQDLILMLGMFFAFLTNTTLIGLIIIYKPERTDSPIKIDPQSS